MLGRKGFEVRGMKVWDKKQEFWFRVRTLAPLYDPDTFVNPDTYTVF